MWKLAFLWLCSCTVIAQSFSPEWRWRPEGDPDWRRLPLGEFPETWTGDGWFAFEIDENTHFSDPVLVVGACGEVQLYIDDQKLEPVARVSAPALTRRGESGMAPPHLVYNLPLQRQRLDVSLRYTGYSPHAIATKAMKHHFHVDLQSGTALLARQAELIRTVSRHEMFLFGLYLSFAIIHLLLFLNFRNMRANLYYAAFAGSASIIGISFYGFYAILDYEQWFDVFRLSTLMLALNQLMAVRLAYDLVSLRTCRIYHLIIGIFAVLSVWGLIQPFLIFEIQGSIVLIALAEVTRTVLTYSKRRGKPAVAGSKVLLWGAIPSGIALLYQLAVFNIPGIPRIASYIDFPIILYAPLPLMMAMSLLLSRFFAQTNRELQLRLAEVEQLSRESVDQERERARLAGENERKNRELEHARALQLSLLPRKMPNLPGYQIGAFMQTATEVGGDYYDFHTHEDGSLLAVVGDATGHGLRAGNMVVATKSLLGAYTHIPMPGALLTQLGQDLKRINFKGMFMAMSAVLVREQSVHLAVAGMPSALHFRAATGEVQILPRGSLPLGAPVEFSYSDLCLDLAPNDALLLMSDGLQERFNARREMLGLDKVIEVFRENALQTPNRLIEALIEQGESFAAGEPLDDDITLLVLRRIA